MHDPSTAKNTRRPSREPDEAGIPQTRPGGHSPWACGCGLCWHRTNRVRNTSSERRISELVSRNCFMLTTGKKEWNTIQNPKLSLSFLCGIMDLLTVAKRSWKFWIECSSWHVRWPRPCWRPLKQRSHDGSWIVEDFQLVIKCLRNALLSGRSVASHDCSFWEISKNDV